MSAADLDGTVDICTVEGGAVGAIAYATAAIVHMLIKRVRVLVVMLINLREKGQRRVPYLLLRGCPECD